MRRFFQKKIAWIILLVLGNACADPSLFCSANLLHTKAVSSHTEDHSAPADIHCKFDLQTPFINTLTADATSSNASQPSEVVYLQSMARSYDIISRHAGILDRIENPPDFAAPPIRNLSQTMILLV